MKRTSVLLIDCVRSVLSVHVNKGKYHLMLFMIAKILPVRKMEIYTNSPFAHPSQRAVQRRTRKLSLTDFCEQRSDVDGCFCAGFDVDSAVTLCVLLGRCIQQSNST